MSLMCLPFSRLFWVSSLAYPNLLRTKGYVVFVVVFLFICIAGSFGPLTWGTDPSRARHGA
jgi:hypothetical protein